jgi:hypothetical protein
MMVETREKKERAYPAVYNSGPVEILALLPLVRWSNRSVPPFFHKSPDFFWILPELFLKLKESVYGET